MTEKRILEDTMVAAFVAEQALPFAPEANLVWVTPRKLARLLWAADGKTEAA